MFRAPLWSLSHRILCRLKQAEALERNPHYQDDYRIARLTVAHAARGDCRLCSPHVAASYEVLGLHPDKVWRAIVARRKAVLGPAYGRWFGPDGNQLEEIGVLKKPPGSVRFEREERLKKVSGAELRVPRHVETVEPLMAATAPDYRTSDAPESSKKSPQQWRLEIEQLIDSADFSREIEAVVVKKVAGVKQKVRCKRVYRRSHLNARLKAIWQASTSPYPMNSSKGEVFCYAALEKYAEKAKVCPSTLRSSLRELDNYNFKIKEPDPNKLGILVLVSKANSANRPTTYQFNLSRLRELVRRQPRPTPIRAQRRWHQSSPDRSSPPAQEAAASPTPPAPAAAPVAVAQPTVKLGSRAFERIRDLRIALLGAMTHGMEQGLSQQEALEKVCGAWGVTEKEALEQLEGCHFKPPSPKPPENTRPAKFGGVLPPQLSPERDPWRKILRALKAKINPHSFETWLSPTRYLGEQEGVLYVRIPTAEFRQIGDKYQDLIREAISSLGMEYRDVQFEEAEPGP